MTNTNNTRILTQHPSGTDTEPATKTPRYFVGWNLEEGYIIFRDRVIPTQKTHGHRYGFVIGPFSRKAGALHAIDVQHRGWY